MITDNDIQSIIKHVVDTLKPYDKAGVYFLPSKNDGYIYPEYYEGYNEICQQYDDILIHTKVGRFPDKLLGQRAPNMTEQEWEYIKNNYRSWTVPIFMDFLNTVKRCFNDNNYSIIFPEETEGDIKYKGDNSLRKYIEYGIEEYGSLDNFFRYLYPSLRLQDVNGCIVVRPTNFEKVETDEGYQYYEDSTELRKPMLFYYDCKRVILVNEDYFLIEISEKSECHLNGKKQNVGHVYELHTKDSIYRIIQVGKYTEFEFEIKLLVQHNIGEIQARRIGGIPDLIDGELHYAAEMLYAVGNLDTMLLNLSNLQLAVNNGVFPIRVMIGNECDFVDKQNGYTCNGGQFYDGNQSKIGVCTSCQGSGLKHRISVMGNILIKPKTLDSDQEIKASDAIHSHSTETTTLDFLMKKIADDESRARSILHLKGSIEQSAGENVVESGANVKANYAFIKPISDQIFSMYQWVIDMFGKWREGDSYKKITINTPNSFDFYTEKDYIALLQQANTANLPPFVIYTIMWKFLNTLYFTEKETSRAFHLIMAADRLLTLNDTAISNGQTKGNIANWEIILHQSGINLVQELEQEDGFWKLEMPEQIEKLKELAKQKEIQVGEGSGENKLIDSNISSLNG